MFAVIKTGGKQYKVAPNDIIMVEKLMGASGDSIEFTNVLMVGQGEAINVGSPLIVGTTVHGTILDQIRDDKIIVFKKKKRHNYRRKKGHRQSLTVVQITDILSGGQAPKVKAGAPKPAVEKATPTKTSAAKEAAPKRATPKAKKTPTTSGE